MLIKVVIIFVLFQVSYGEVDVNTSKTFPIKFQETFTLTLNTKEDNSSVILVIRDIDDLEIQRDIIGLWKTKELDFNVNESHFYTIIKVEKTNDQQTSLSINFRRNALRKILELHEVDYYISQPNQPKLGRSIYRAIIDFIKLPELSIEINYFYNEKNQRFANITCLSFDGIPILLPNFSKEYKLKLINEKYWQNKLSPKSSFARITVEIEKKNDYSLVFCYAGYLKQVIRNATIRYPDHPIDMKITPNVNFVIKNNCPIVCSATKGYPLPIIEWEIKQGPPDMLQYIDIKNSQFIIKNAPQWSYWQIQCKIISKINQDYQYLQKNISFVINDDDFTPAINKALFNIIRRTLKRFNRVDARVLNISAKVEKLDKKISRCPRTFIGFQNHCYQMSTDRYTFTHAKKECIRKGTDLVWIENKEELEFLDKKFQDKPFYIGWYDNNWINGNKGIKLDRSSHFRNQYYRRNYYKYRFRKSFDGTSGNENYYYVCKFINLSEN